MASSKSENTSSVCTCCSVIFLVGNFTTLYFITLFVSGLKTRYYGLLLLYPRKIPFVHLSSNLLLFCLYAKHSDPNVLTLERLGILPVMAWYGVFFQAFVIAPVVYMSCCHHCIRPKFFTDIPCVKRHLPISKRVLQCRSAVNFDEVNYGKIYHAEVHFS